MKKCIECISYLNNISVTNKKLHSPQSQSRLAGLQTPTQPKLGLVQNDSTHQQPPSNLNVSNISIEIKIGTMTSFFHYFFMVIVWKAIGGSGFSGKMSLGSVWTRSMSTDITKCSHENLHIWIETLYRWRVYTVASAALLTIWWLISTPTDMRKV